MTSKSSTPTSITANGAAAGMLLRDRREYIHVGSRPECRITTSLLRSVPKKHTHVHASIVVGCLGRTSAKVYRGMDAEVQAIPWMDQPALAPVGSVFCGRSPEVAWDVITE